MKINYAELGLKVGLEVHQQLETRYKLFCSCKNMLEDEVIGEFSRKLRPTKSELGEYDPAALMEFSRDRTYVYQITPNTSCLVELDEEPPHPINQEAVEIAIACALLMNSKIVDEVHVMRKEVIDGSNTTGFQRTAIVALGGYIMDGEEKIDIQTITLEEDSCRKIKEDSKMIVYRLDRQGIPLIEIATAPRIKDPEQARRVAYKIGMLVYSTGKARRSLGTIRQDINLSISNGAKTEIKGIQELSMIPKVIEYEVMRQLKLLELKDLLISKNVPKPEKKVYDITDLFKNTRSNLIRKHLEACEIILALPLKKMKGLLKFEVQPNRRFASELADYVKAWTKLEGLIHSDELPAYGITDLEVKSIYERLNLADEDAFIMVIGEKEECDKAIDVIIERINVAFVKVPEETRNAMPDGTTRFARIRPGSARMYVETDIPPFVVTNNLIEKVRFNLPLKIEDRIAELQSKYNLSSQLAQELIDSQSEQLFEKIVSIGIKPTIAATTLTQTLKYLKRSGLNIENLTERHFWEAFLAMKDGKIAKESIELIFSEWIKSPSMSLNELIEKLGLKLLSEEELKKAIEVVISENIDKLKENKDRMFEFAMKIVMSKLRGKADSSKIAEIVKEKIKQIAS
ncbi:MAG: Glu-tRNA(Gln) amidotransferase subunit GatE [Thermoproteota archaeon]|jgi:glutamyl-tRNA(Gln) amidotransferase subunit E|nr:Glu-tRNA(Gln) amidotransferase subunit GatE [Thermoproteota archaeon]